MCIPGVSSKVSSKVIQDILLGVLQGVFQGVLQSVLQRCPTRFPPGFPPRCAPGMSSKVCSRDVLQGVLQGCPSWCLPGVLQDVLQGCPPRWPTGRTHTHFIFLSKTLFTHPQDNIFEKKWRFILWRLCFVNRGRIIGWMYRILTSWLLEIFENLLYWTVHIARYVCEKYDKRVAI
jgi:hypothetical protein